MADNTVYARDTVFDGLKHNPEEFVTEARGRRMSLGTLLQQKCPTRGASYSHPIVVRDFLAREGLSLRPQGRKPSSRIGEFQQPHQKALLGDHYDDIFQRSFSGNPGYRDYEYSSYEDRELAEKLELRESGLALTAFQSHTPFRPRQTGALEYDMYMAEVPYSDLAREVDVLDAIDTQIPVVEVPKDQLLMQETPEGDDPPRVIIGHKTKNATMYRYAITLSLTDMVANNRNSVLVSAIEREIMWIGVRYDQMFSYKIARRIMAMADDAVGGISRASKDLDADGILDMQSSFTDGRMADRIIGAKEPVLKYIAALSAIFGGTANQIGWADGSGSEAHRIIAQPVLGNRMSRPERAYYFTDTTALAAEDDIGDSETDTALPERSLNADWDDDLVWYDSMRSITRLEYVGGVYDQMSTDAPKALHERTFARWLGYYEQEDPAVVAYTVQ